MREGRPTWRRRNTVCTCRSRLRNRPRHARLLRLQGRSPQSPVRERGQLLQEAELGSSDYSFNPEAAAGVDRRAMR
jgi:hypothetical protein